MRIDKLTNKFQLALQDAQSIAVGKDHQFITPEHLLAAFIDQPDGGIKNLLAQAGGNLNTLRGVLEERLSSLPSVSGTGGDVHISNDLGKLLNVCDKMAQQRGDQFISSEMFLLASIEDKGQLSNLLKQSGLTKASLEKAIDAIRGGQAVNDPNTEEQRQALEKYTIDLTARAEQGKLDPVIGRDEEIRRAIQVLQRRTKNNPVLIGEPGVGKTPPP